MDPAIIKETGISISEAVKCRHCTFRTIPFLHLNTHNSHIEEIVEVARDTIDTLWSWRLRIESVSIPRLFKMDDATLRDIAGLQSMKPLVESCMYWIHVGILDASLQDLLEVKVARRITAELETAGYDEWTHHVFCVVNGYNMGPEELEEASFDWEGVPENQSFRWDDEDKTLYWLDEHDRRFNHQEEEKPHISFPQFADGKDLQKVIWDDKARGEWHTMKHRHHDFHDLNETTCPISPEDSKPSSPGSTCEKEQVEFSQVEGQDSASAALPKAAKKVVSGINSRSLRRLQLLRIGKKAGGPRVALGL